jgi:ABC-type uncharacterized transport system ATPase component
MSKKILYVTIAGTTGSGKTTLAQAIRTLCNLGGVEVSVHDEDIDAIPCRAMSNLAGKVEVSVTTAQIHRKSL